MSILRAARPNSPSGIARPSRSAAPMKARSEEHTSELQSPCNLVCRLLLEKKKKLLNCFAVLLFAFLYRLLAVDCLILSRRPRRDLLSFYHLSTAFFFCMSITYVCYASSLR